MSGLKQATTARRQVSEEPGKTGSGQLFDHLGIVGDPLRCRILLLLEAHELTVSELCTVLQLPQSTVSRHLKSLADHEWIEARRDGTRRRYSRRAQGGEQALQDLWLLLKQEMSTSNAALQDRNRLATVLAERRTRSQKFFSSAAGEWAAMRDELFGRRFDLEGLLGLIDEAWTIGDLGCGTGQTTETLAPYARKVVAVDESEAMLSAARRRLGATDNIEIHHGRLEQLPLQDDSLDAAIMMLVLHHLPDPGAAIAEAARVLRSGGKLLIVDMLAHEHAEYRQTMGHLWLGFESRQIRQWCEKADLEVASLRTLRAEVEAKGPTLFAATARANSPKTTTPSGEPHDLDHR